MGGAGGFTCIPEEVVTEVQTLLESLDLFLGGTEEMDLTGISLEQRVTRLVINGHLPLPCSLMVAREFLGKYDTTSLPLAVLKSLAIGETRGDGRGNPVVKLKPGIYGRGHDLRVAHSL